MLGLSLLQEGAVQRDCGTLQFKSNGELGTERARSAPGTLRRVLGKEQHAHEARAAGRPSCSVRTVNGASLVFTLLLTTGKPRPRGASEAGRPPEGEWGGLASQRPGVAGPAPPPRGARLAADIRLPVGVVQMLPEARDSERILEPFQDPASAGLTWRQALGPAGACVNRTTRSLFTHEMAPLCQRTRASRARVTEVQRCGPAGSGGGAEAGSSSCSSARRRPGCAARFLAGTGLWPGETPDLTRNV